MNLPEIANQLQRALALVPDVSVHHDGCESLVLKVGGRTTWINEEGEIIGESNQPEEKP